MKKFQNYLSKPIHSISIAALIIIITGGYMFTRIGTAPTVPLSLQTDSAHDTITSGSTVSLSFAQSGRVQDISVKEGDVVTKGQILARLSAPQAEGAVTQAKGALELAQAQYSSLNSQYKTTKEQQDTLVKNAYATLLSSGLEATGSIQDPNVPVISGTYTCGKEGKYVLEPYVSNDSDTGFSVRFAGIEEGNFGVKFSNPVPMGACGLQVKFNHVTNFNPYVTWTVSIPNTKSSLYLANKNAYDLAINTREKVLTDLATTIGQNNGGDSVAKAQITAAEGAYQAALGAYQNNVITSPVSGVVTFVDANLKVGQSATASKSVISITAQ